jgi:hypothetical protein
VSGFGGRQLSVREGCTRRRRARGSDGEFRGGRGGATRWLNSGRNGSVAVRRVEEEERKLHGGGGCLI